jgi:hypothetical protein
VIFEESVEDGLMNAMGDLVVGVLRVKTSGIVGEISITDSPWGTVGASFLASGWVRVGIASVEEEAKKKEPEEILEGKPCQKPPTGLGRRLWSNRRHPLFFWRCCLI